MQTLAFDYDQIQHGRWNELMDSTRVVVLEVTDSSSISFLHKVKYHDHKLFAFDIRQQKIFVFDEFGHFLYRFETGPGAEEELISIRDFEIYNDKVFILGYLYIKIYDLNGGYIGKTKIPVEKKEYSINATSFCVTSDSTYYMWEANDALAVLPKEDKTRLIRLSSNGNIQDQGIMSVFTGIAWGNIFGHSQFGRTIIPFVDKNDIYYLEKGQLIRKYVLDFGSYDLSNKRNLLKSISDELELSNLFTSQEYSFCGKIINFTETKSFYFFSTICQGHVRHNFIFKRSNNRVYFDLTKKESKGIYPNFVYDVQENQIISSMLHIDLLNLISEYNDGNFNHLSQNQRDLIASLKDYTDIDNPVVVLSSLKVSE